MYDANAPYAHEANQEAKFSESDQQPYFNESLLTRDEVESLFQFIFVLSSYSGFKKICFRYPFVR